MTNLDIDRPTTTTTRRRPPWTLHVAAGLLTLMNTVMCVGAVYFGTHEDPTRPPGAPDPSSWQAYSLVVILLGYSLAGLLAIPGLYRRSRTAWCVALGFLAAHFLFGALKLLGLGEDAALLFVAVDVLVAAFLVAAPTRRYVGV
jgi:lysylphosphatidylglycerol synthetase-like protein (DUF2156 family)